MSNPIVCLSRQNENTWASFHRRVSGIAFNYEELFSDAVFRFLEAKAKSIGSSVGYLLPSLITATSFLLTNNDAHFLNGTHLQPLNLYTMPVGHPGTGKSPAIETVLAALRDVDTITKETLVSATTSSGLVKTISKQGKAFVASPELFDILNKLLKNDEDNATGDVQLLCKLWSGESASYHFATEATREIESNTAFSLLGSTQIQNAALLIFRMDKGHGLLDRFLISVPNARKPTPEQEEEATEYLEGLQLKDFQTVFASVHAAHRDITRSYRLNTAAAELHKRLKTEHVNAVDAAIENGEVPPKSKGTDLVTRVAVAFNAIDFFIAALLNEQPTNNPPEQITEACYKKAVQYVEYLHAQKEMFADFIKEIVETSKEKPRPQPTELDITAAILRFPGRLVTYQAFKKFAPRCLRSVQKQEYRHCTQRLQHYGRVVELRVPRCAQKMHVFIKKTAAEIINWPADAPCTQEQYNERISEPLNPLITENIQTALINAGHITDADLV